MNKLFFYIFIFLLLTGCARKYNRQDSEKYMVTEHIDYVKDFTNEITLSTPYKINVNLSGITGFQIFDSICVLTTKGENGIIACTALNSSKVLGRFLNIGNSQDEIIFPSSLSTGINIYNYHDSLYIDILDGQKGRMLTANVSESLIKNCFAIKNISHNLSNNCFITQRLKNGLYFIREITNGDTQQTRMIRDLKTGKNSTPKILARLNTASVAQGEDFNIISTITKVSKDNRIIEMPIGLNYINIYKIDGSFAKTLCIGDKLDDIDEIMNTDKWNRLYTFSDVRVFDNSFGVVQINEEEKSYQTKREKLPSILLFSMEGKPLARIKLKRHITSFDIDTKNGYLYTLDDQTEEFLKYKIPQELKAVLDR